MTRLRLQWTCEESGWWVADAPDFECVSVLREGGMWHAYTTLPGKPVYSRHKTMRAAMRAAERAVLR